MTAVDPGDVVARNYCYFLADEEFEDTTRPGFRRRVITGEQLQLCFWRIAGGSTGSYLHQHEAHEQLGVVVRGELDFRIGDTDDRQVLRSGDIYLAPMKVWHGDSVFVGDDELDECWILDVFSPPRADLLRPDAEPDVTRTDDLAEASDATGGEAGRR